MFASEKAGRVSGFTAIYKTGQSGAYYRYGKGRYTTAETSPATCIALPASASQNVMVCEITLTRKKK